MPNEICVKVRKSRTLQYERFKEKLAADPVFKEQYLEKQRKRNAELRQRKKDGETPEEKARRQQRAREAISKAVRASNARRSAERQAKAKAQEQSGEKVAKSKDTVKIDNKRKPGRILALMGWRGFG